MSQLSARLFSTPEMDLITSDHAFVQRMLHFESVLSEALAAVNLIPRPAATVIADTAKNTFVDITFLNEQSALAGNPAIPLLKILTDKVKAKEEEAAKYVHWGATSQDVIDTALMLELKEGSEILLRDLQSLRVIMEELAVKYARTAMAGRTLLQQARPVSFGYKVAVWLDGLNYSCGKLEALREQLFTVQLGGASGTLSAYGHLAENVVEFVAQKLVLNVFDIPWHSQRYRIVEIGTSLCLLCSCLGKMASDLILLMQTEVGEVFEGALKGRGGSSAMPHKRNPVLSVYIVAIADKANSLMSGLMNSLMHEHERSAGHWHGEWGTLSELMRLSAASLGHAMELMKDIEVDEHRMQQNLELTKGLVYAEDVALHLLKTADRNTAHTLVKQACLQVAKEKVSLREYLRAEGILTDEEAATIFSQERAIGPCELFIKRVLKNIK